MKLRIKNSRILSFILANAIILSQCGCSNRIHSEDAINSNPTHRIEIENEVETNQDKKKQQSKDNKENKEKKLKECNRTVCSKKKLTMREKNSKESDEVRKVGEYQKLKEIGTTQNGWSLIQYKGREGYVKSKNLANLGKTYIEIDISDQKLTYYKDGEKFLSTNVVTGRNTLPTVTGLFTVYAKNENYTMNGFDPITKSKYTSFSKYVLKFYKAYYIHDSNRTEFGGNIYKNNGSHGCVNTPYKKVKKLYENTKLNTKVLVHK